jgi:zinc/manganese transport system permease protein
MLGIMLPALVAALLLLSLHAYLGIHIIARGVIFVDLAIAQMAALGWTAAVFVGFEAGSLSAYLVGLLTALLAAGLFSVTRMDHRYITQEAIIGIVFVVASAATILLASQAPRGAEHVQELLTGSLLWVTWPKIARIAVIYAVLGLLHWLFRRRFLTISLQPKLARSAGWSIAGWDFLFYALFGIMVTLSVEVAGVLLVFSFLVIPAVVAFLFTGKPGALLAIAWMSGSAATVAGLVVSYMADLPTGPVVVCAFAALLPIAFALRRIVGGKRLPASEATL